MVEPPARLMAWPVRYSAASEARKAASSATSAGVATRPPAEVVQAIRVRDAGTDGVHGDPGRRQLERERLGEADDAELRRAVGGAVRAPHLAELGGHVDDTAAEAPLEHGGDDRPGTEVGALEIGVDHGVPHG